MSNLTSKWHLNRYIFSVNADSSYNSTKYYRTNFRKLKSDSNNVIKSCWGSKVNLGAPDLEKQVPICCDALNTAVMELNFLACMVVKGPSPTRRCLLGEEDLTLLLNDQIWGNRKDVQSLLTQGQPHF